MLTSLTDLQWRRQGFIPVSADLSEQARVFQRGQWPTHALPWRRHC